MVRNLWLLLDSARLRNKPPIGLKQMQRLKKISTSDQQSNVSDTVSTTCQVVMIVVMCHGCSVEEVTVQHQQCPCWAGRLVRR